MVTLGPRVLKTGIAVTVALYICSFLNLEQAIFAGVAAIFTLQPSIYQTWKQLLDQVVTNTLGALIALFCLYYFGNSPIVIGSVLIFVISITLKLKMEANVISLTLVTVIAIMSAPGDVDWIFAFNRFLTILIGIVSALLVNIILFPPKFKGNYYGKVKESFNKLSLLLRTAISNELKEKTFKEDWESLQSDIKKLEELYKILNEERKKMSRVNPLDVKEIVVFRQMLKALQHGEKVISLIEEHFFQGDADQEDSHMFDEHLEHLIKYHEYYLLKYEGKVKDEDDIYHIEEETSVFLKTLLNEYDDDVDKKFRILAVGFSIFEYAFQLQRLDELVSKYKRVKA
ncbi:uncharacterized membrane protein YgaE (UPF0421/DUF939 family) [Salirhabdus euzebyi]|uniref:Uncharacterized membrane protein YgaE (UPF0421/DUF939 family) n=1 Tax=Salirhabdus euzebyi TaxID=394506 RepID=A0A841PSE7_9BACI|nr:aromatic acid exporter family protein [Salirhabdus euzebyi]MBB6451857.1 uncharacterized membrane protein YgaE (UPF0421/DUF939 family) [Salirhabdus euzebyi]